MTCLHWVDDIHILMEDILRSIRLLILQKCFIFPFNDLVLISLKVSTSLTSPEQSGEGSVFVTDGLTMWQAELTYMVAGALVDTFVDLTKLY